MKRLLIILLFFIGCGEDEDSGDQNCSTILSLSEFQELIENGLLNPAEAVEAGETTSGDVIITVNTCVENETETTSTVVTDNANNPSSDFSPQ